MTYEILKQEVVSVPCIDICKKLNWRFFTNFVYVHCKDVWNIHSKEYFLQNLKDDYEEAYYAPQSHEILDKLPQCFSISTKTKKEGMFCVTYVLEIKKVPYGYSVAYIGKCGKEVFEHKFSECTLVDTLANVYLFLKAQGQTI